jgi:hypothetical protein
MHECEFKTDNGIGITEAGYTDKYHIFRELAYYGIYKNKLSS